MWSVAKVSCPRGPGSGPLRSIRISRYGQDRAPWKTEAGPATPRVTETRPRGVRHASGFADEALETAGRSLDGCGPGGLGVIRLCSGTEQRDATRAARGKL